MGEIKFNLIRGFGPSVFKVEIPIEIIDSNFDFQGESVGFFKFSRNASFILLNESKKIMKNNRNAMYEDAIQKIIKYKKFFIAFENITNLPWVEIDFKKDLQLAKKNILKRINE